MSRKSPRKKPKVSYAEDQKSGPSDVPTVSSVVQREEHEVRSEAKTKSPIKSVATVEMSEVEMLKARIYYLTRELQEAKPYIAQFHELSTKFAQIQETNEKLVKELALERKNVKDMHGKLLDAVLQSATVDIKLQNSEENFKFKEEVFKQQLDTRTSDHAEITSNIDRLLKEYFDKFQSEVKRNTKEVSELFDSKFQNLENELQFKIKAGSATDDISTVKSIINEIFQQNNDVLSSKHDLLVKIADLEERLQENERVKYVSEIHELSNKLTAMQDDMSIKEKEYQDLIDAKTTLYMELNSYQGLLEREKSLPSITPNSPVSGGSLKGKKRKLLQCYATDNVSESLVGVILVGEVCPNGQFVKLYNKGSKEVVLGGYELVQTTSAGIVCFKFHRTVKLGAGNWLTIWSSTATGNQEHRPSAGSIVMNSQSWFVGDSKDTMLLNAEGQEIATHELRKPVINQ